MSISDEIYLKSTNTAEEFINRFMQCLEFEDYSISTVTTNKDILYASKPREFSLYLRNIDSKINAASFEGLPFTPTYHCSIYLEKFGDILRVKHELITATIKYTKLMVNDVLAYIDGDSDIIIYYNQSLTLRENHPIWKGYSLNEIEYKFDKLPNL